MCQRVTKSLLLFCLFSWSSAGSFFSLEHNRLAECQDLRVECENLLDETRTSSENCEARLIGCAELLNEARALLENHASGLTSCADLVDQLAVMAYPRNFHGVDELTKWLEDDDTDKYLGGHVSERAFRLQHSARRDGSYMGITIVGADQVVNVAIVPGHFSGHVYHVDPSTHSIRWAFDFEDGVTGEVGYQTSH